MKINIENCNFPGIYVIKNLVNNKIYVGKSKNCYKRLHQHITDIKIDNRNYNENPHLLNAFKKYGFDNFDYYIVEKFESSLENLEQLLTERELYWMLELDSLNREKGYNLRYDSQGKCFCSKETSKKISERLKKEWADGVRKEHGNKLKNYWKDNDERKKAQSELFSKTKTKYKYEIYDPEGNLITKEGNYKTLKEYKLNAGALSAFSKHKTDEVICKKYKIIRHKIC